MEYEMENKTSLWTIIKRFLLGILLIAVIVFILLWLFPTKSSLNPLLQDVFRRNIESMRDAGDTYFTNERMPKNVGDKVRITLGEMLEKNLLLPFVDKNGKSCSNTESYIEITKTDTEYEMKVNLSCSNEEAFIIEHLGCTDRCNDCDNKCQDCQDTNENKGNNPTNPTNPILEYQFQKLSSTKVIDRYECPKGYEKDPENAKACYKVENKVITTPMLEDKKEYKKDVSTKTTYKYLYSKTTDKTYSKWSDWSEDKEYTESDNIIWGEQELVINEKNGYKKTTITTTKMDKSKPIYQETYDNVVGTYKQYVCKDYKYFRDSSTSTTYSTTDWKLQETITLEYVPKDTMTKKYVYIGMDYTRCSDSCTLKPYYIYKVYTRTVNPVTKTGSQLAAECNVEEKTINVYGLKKTFVGYITYQEKEYKYTYYYHTKTRTITDEGNTTYKWSTSSNDKKLIKDGYKYTGTNKVASTTKYCKENGYELNKDKTACVKTVITKYCEAGTVKSGNACKKVIKETKTADATPIYKTVNSIIYKWSRNKTLEGWTPTGKTRKVYA